MNHRLIHANTALHLALALFLAPFAALYAGDAPKHNVIFILADDLGWADTTLYGHTKFYRTPNLERLAKRGMTFTRAYSASPLCSPTRSAILTGLSPARTGITTPNCHVPQIVLEATTGKKAAPHQRSRSDAHQSTGEISQGEEGLGGCQAGQGGCWILNPPKSRAMTSRPHALLRAKNL